MGLQSGRLRALTREDIVRRGYRFVWNWQDAARRLPLVGSLLLATIATACLPSPASGSQFARIDYNVHIGAANRYRHTFFVELFDDRPVTTANFLQYVNGNAYLASIMHRLAYSAPSSTAQPSTWTPFVLQGGGYYPQFISEPHPNFASLPYSLNPILTVDLDGNSSTPNPTIASEAGKSPARSNVKGTLAMALGATADSATSQWFINLDNNSFLDTASPPFTVFGKVAGDGMNYVDALIASLSVRNMNPDANDNGVREAGPFYTSRTDVPTDSDGTPLFFSGGSVAALQIVRAEQIDYFGPGTSTVVDGTWSLAARNAVIDSGAIFTGPVDNGIVLGPGRSLQVREGFSFGRDLESHGIVAPGLEIGTITTRNYVQNFDATLAIDLAGPTLDTQYDRVVATGAAFLSGKLDVNFAPGYSPTLNTTFSIVNANQIVGEFLLYDLPSLAAGLVWRINRSNTAFTLSVAGGDYNRNGIVDAADYALWRKTRGTLVTPGSGADGDGNGTVNDNDYVVWRSNLGNIRGISAGSGLENLSAGNIPEPAGVMLAVIAGFWLVKFRAPRAKCLC
jgi:cyclophilin family peptidyl-prolyl cis-trans isomerase